MLGLQLPANLSRLELRKEVIQLNSQVLPGLLVLTPKFGTGRSLICGPSLVKKIRPEEGRFL
jgi:hypothetical protein